MKFIISQLSILGFSSHPVELISIIIATYNRPDVLKYAILSVLNQSYANIEVLVIGDGCSANTAKVINSISDNRLFYHNLAENCGEQSGPNNYGLSIAKGDFIAFLNHDDLWFSDHLESLIKCLKTSNAQLVYSLYAAPHPTDKTIISNTLQNTQNIDIQLMYPASSIIIKREIYEKIGGWKYFREIYDMPSQDWVNRIYKSGFKIASSNRLSMIAIQSGKRKNSYKNSNAKEQLYYFERIKNNPELLRSEILMEQIILQNQRISSFKGLMKILVGKILNSFFSKFGITRRSLRFKRKYKMKGGYIDFLREYRGLENKT